MLGCLFIHKKLYQLIKSVGECFALLLFIKKVQKPKYKTCQV